MHKIDLPDFILERSKGLRGDREVVFDTLDPARTAHVVVDLQNGFMREGAAVEVTMAPKIVPAVNKITKALRDAGGLVVYLRYTYDADEPMDWSAWYGEMLSGPVSDELKDVFSPGHPDFELWPDLDVQPQDWIVNKTRFSAFVPGTCDLHEMLAEKGIDTLIITGTLTNCCCESTARDANQRNYRVVFVTDGNATHTDYEHNATLANMAAIFADLQSSDQVVDGIARASAKVAAE
ncbi:MAG: isochorismatase family cysteine hydrolase [Pseudomonadota bacterium]